MKRYFSILFISITFVSCQENVEVPQAETPTLVLNDANPLETALYNCLVKQYADQNLDLPAIHQELENLAIGTGNLEDGSALAYYNMFKLAASAGHFPLKNEDLFFMELAQIKNFPLDLNCNTDHGVAESVAKTSKLSKYNRLLSVEISSTRNKGIQPNTAIPIVKAYTQEDFENEFIQMSMLAFISYRTSIENKIYKKDI